MMGMPDKARRLNWPILIGMLLTLNLALLLTPQAMVDLSPPPMPTSTVTPIPPTRTPPGTPTPTATPVPSPTPTCAPGRWEAGSVQMPATGVEILYQVYLPPCGDPARRYPALYLLHGYPYDQTHWDQLGIHKAMEAGIRAGRWPPFLIVLPGFPDDLYLYTSGGPGSVEAAMMEVLIPHIEARYPVETARWARAIGGISRGGVWALEIALRHPEAFASVGGHSPALSVNQAPPAYDPFQLTQEADLQGLRIYLDAGDTDWALAGTQQLAEILKARGIPIRLEIHPGGHEDTAWAQALEAYLDFYTEPWRGLGR
ncbi:alpha/beta hydrolase [Thermoflexus sp.]|uniref:alpha/beta hydrolase n=1 Tax=Thermoflexus sp. TaxID=1969742 RepID=UPI0018103441|nr:alpha/beta hydrolase-fold protein [Thermoflexus sp.]